MTIPKDTALIHGIDEMRARVSKAHAGSLSIGLVPTMGALHEGHLSLVRRAAADNDLCIVSVFVNPIQFDDPGDLAGYPGTLDEDAAVAAAAGADVVFAPAASEMYPDGFSTYVDMTGVSERLCGASRASHFRGVLTVVAKLFGICMPDRAYFGEKDAQQLAVVQKMAAELCMNLTVVGCPTVREEDGLAMSSRNSKLRADERTAAHCLYRALCEAKTRFASGETNAENLIAAMRSVIGREALARIDYIEIADPLTFETVRTARTGDIAALAVYIGGTRLIDNMRL